MLHKLYLKDFILISNVEIDFKSGFSVFIGETGAGKSLIVDALQIISGERIKGNVIRKNCEKAIVEAVFIIEDENIKKALNELNIDFEDEIIITKEITAEKTYTKLNHRNITNTLLKQVSKYLINIYAQQSVHTFSKQEYLSNLDSLYELDLTSYQNAYLQYISYLQEKEILLSDQDLDENYLRFQLEEIMQVNPKVNEDEDLLLIQKNYLTSVKQRQAIEHYLEDINLKGVYGLGQLFNHEKLLDNYYEIEEIISEIQSNLDNIDDIDIDEIQERLFKIQALKKKHGGSIEKILEKKADLEKKLLMLDDKVYAMSVIDQKISNQFRICYDLAKAISNQRKNNAQKLEQLLVNELSDLNFNFIDFKIDFKETDLSETGIDELTYMISLNKGEVRKDIIEVASGGELSRIILALKAIFAKTQDLETLVFDEIDIGVSGKVALSIGKKMHKIAQHKQVLCVTHLAAVAACASQHYVVLKEEDENSTHSYAKALNEVRLIEELALISSSHTSEIALENAKNLLALARKEIQYE